MKSILIIAFVCWVTLATHAQTTTNKKQITAQDSVALNLLTTVARVVNIAEDAKQQAMALAGKQLSTNADGVAVYESTVQLPGYPASTLTQYSTRRTEKLTTWNWETVLIDQPKSQGPATIKQLQTKVDSILSFFTKKNVALNNKPHMAVVSTIDQLYDWRGNYTLLLQVSFTKPLHNTLEQAVDSIDTLYRPLLSVPLTAAQLGEKYQRAMEAEEVSNERIKKEFTAMVKAIADKNIQAAFNLVMRGRFYINAKEVNEQLSTGQQQQMKTMATQLIDEYNAQFKKPAPKTDAVAAQKKEIQKATPPTDKCKRQLWEMGLELGSFISGEGKDAQLIEHDCNTNQFKIAWLDKAKNKIMFASINQQQIKNYKSSTQFPFLLCNHCKGVGYFMEYDWYQMGVGSSFYARSTKQRLYTCGVCSGKGYIQVR